MLALGVNVNAGDFFEAKVSLVDDVVDCWDGCSFLFFPFWICGGRKEARLDAGCPFFDPLAVLLESSLVHGA